MTTPTPMYDEGRVALYIGDCREILPRLDPVDVVLTDPPWQLTTELMPGTRDAVALWSDVAPLLRTRRLLLWLPVHADPRPWLAPVPLPYLRFVYIRRAVPGYYGRVLMDGEIVHVLGEWPPSRPGRRVIPGGCSITYVAADRLNGHPGPRSLIATQWLLRWWSDPDETILDPFAGSGTTLEAAKLLGRRAIGIEIVPEYCALAIDRLRQGVLW